MIKINLKKGRYAHGIPKRRFSSYFNQNQSKTRCNTIKHFFPRPPSATHIFLTIPFQTLRHRVPFVAGNRGDFTVHLDIMGNSLEKPCIIKEKKRIGDRRIEFSYLVKSEFSDKIFYGFLFTINKYKSSFESYLSYNYNVL